MKRFILLLVCVGWLGAPRLGAQLLVNDPLNTFQSGLIQANSYTSMLTNLEMLKRTGDVTEALTSMQKIMNTALKAAQTVQLLRSLDKNNPWAAVGLAQTWGADPETVGLASDLAAVYQTTRSNAKYGFNPYSLSTYDRAIVAMDRRIQSEREKQARVRAAENAQLAEARAKAAEEVLKQADGAKGPEAHAQATTSILASMAANQADANKLAAEQALAEAQRRKREDGDAAIKMEVMVDGISFSGAGR